ncbi:MAG: HEAT repeat domain-containing protein [Deltaproteobacteria bacterium]|nr:HEAT repeat domain-containing protein [Deltaproteobacteria bacterium]
MCGKIRASAHDWNGCKCQKCGKIRDEGHDWDKDCETCGRCNLKRSNKHNWIDLECSICGQIWPSRRGHILALLKLCHQDKQAAVEKCLVAISGRTYIPEKTALHLLGILKDDKAIEPLAKYLADLKPFSECAIKSLSMFGVDAVDSLLRNMPTAGSIGGRRRLFEALCKVSSVSIDRLAGELTNRQYCQIVAKALGQSGDRRAINPLFEALKTSYFSRSEEREGAISALLQLEAYEELLLLLHDANGSLDTMVAWALGNLGDKRALEPLLEALEKTKPGSYERRTVIKALGNIRDPRATEPLLKILNETDMSIRRDTIIALSKSADGRAVPALRDTIENLSVDELEAHKYAEMGLVRLGNPDFMKSLISMLSVNSSNYDILLEVFRYNKDVLVNAVVAMLELSKEETSYSGYEKTAATYNRLTCLELLDRIKEPGSVNPLLIVLMDDPHYEVRAMAAKTLGRIRDKRAILSLIRAIQDTDSIVRKEAAIALGEIADAQAVEPLVHTLKDSQEEVSAAAVEALGNIGDIRAMEPLTSFIQDSSGLPNMKKALYCAAVSLAKLGAAKQLILWLETPNENLCEYAIIGLTSLEDAEAVQPLTRYLEDSSKLSRNRALAATALGNKGLTAVDPLGEALKNKSREIRESAIVALGNLGWSAIEPFLLNTEDRDLDDRCGWEAWEKLSEDLEIYLMQGHRQA